MRNNSGFTITELLVAAGLSSIIILMGTTLFIDSQKEDQVTRQTAFVSWNTMMVSQFLGKTLRGAGGATIRPWNAIRIEDNCGEWPEVALPACDSSDRITIANEKTNASGAYYPKILVTSYTEGTGVVQITTVDVNGNGLVDPAECALEASMANSTVILVNATDTITRTLRIRSVDLSTCRLNTDSERQGSVLDTGALGTETFLNGSVSLVVLKTVYWESSSKRVIKLTKSANTAIPNPADSHVLFENVYDLQFGLGYDVGFRNQKITISNSSTDEVMFNHGSDSMATLGGVGGSKIDLKMLFVGIIMGTSQYKKSALGNSISVLNGPVKSFPDMYLFDVERRFYLRNVLDFL